MQNRWVYAPYLTCDQYSLYYDCTKYNAGSYHPIAIAFQDDLRYRFICYSLKADCTSTDFAIFELYKPRSSKAYVTRIIPINIDL